MQSTEPLRAILRTYNPSYYTDARLNGLSRNDMEFAIRGAGLQDSMALVGPNAIDPVLISKVKGELSNRAALNPPAVGTGGGMLPQTASHRVNVYLSNYGNDFNSGEAPGAAKKTLEEANAALPASYGGNIICIDRASGYFPVSAPVTFTKPTYLHGMGMESAYLLRTFDGPLLTWKAAGGLYHLCIDDDGFGAGARVGASIKLAADSVAQRCTSWEMQGVRVTSGVDDLAWEHILEIDGTAAGDPTGNGVRRIQVFNSPIFGCRTPGETFKITDLVHGHFFGIQMVSAPNDLRQGIKVLSSNRAGGFGSEDVEFVGMHMLGDIYLDGVNLSWRGGMLGWLPWSEAIPSVEIPGSAVNCYVDGIIRGSILNRSVTSHIERHDRPRAFLDFPATIDPLGNGLNYSALAGANRQYYWRSIGAGYITKLGLMIGTQSGNISLSVYRPSGRGRSVRPDDQRTTTGSVACPAPGYQEIALATPIYCETGDFISLSCDNVIATFLRGNTPIATQLTKGRSCYTDASHPGPVDVGGFGLGDQGHPIAIVGVE